MELNKIEKLEESGMSKSGSGIREILSYIME